MRTCWPILPAGTATWRAIASGSASRRARRTSVPPKQTARWPLCSTCRTPQSSAGTSPCWTCCMALACGQVQLTYNTRNLIGDGCTERTDAGLSDFGMAVVRRLNELGMLIDLSHCGRQTTLDAAAVSTRPVACTHTAARALRDIPRNKRDDELLAVAATGGVVGVVAVPSFLTDKSQATLDDVLDHIDHIVDGIGVEHVGIGTDRGVSFETATREEYYAWLAPLGFKPEVNPPWPPGVEGLACAADLPNLTEGLIRRGYDDDAIRSILGGNFLRLYEHTIGER